jgi:adenine-specific DNA methylase
MDSGFAVVAAHPIKSEMSVATPKHQANEPIDLDIIMVCRKGYAAKRQQKRVSSYDEALAVADRQVARLHGAGRRLSRNDVRIIVMAQLLRKLSHTGTTETALAALGTQAPAIEAAIQRLAT